MVFLARSALLLKTTGEKKKSVDVSLFFGKAANKIFSIVCSFLPTIFSTIIGMPVLHVQLFFFFNLFAFRCTICGSEKKCVCVDLMFDSNQRIATSKIGIKIDLPWKCNWLDFCWIQNMLGSFIHLID